MVPHNSVKRLPCFLQVIAEYKEICAAEDVELDQLNRSKDQILANSLVTEADEEGIARYEKMYGIAPKDDILEDRRFRILAYLSSDLPYTRWSLLRKLESACGQGNVSVTVIPNEYKLVVRVALAAASQYNTVYEVIQKMLPCNMILDYDLIYNQHILFEGFTHAQMAEYTHHALRTQYFTDTEGGSDSGN